MSVLIKLFTFKFITSLLALVYSVLQVRYFGASRTIEIYFAAQSLIYLVTSLTQSGQLAEIFLPEYHKLNSIKRGLGLTGLNIVINRMVLWGSLIILFFFIFAPVLIDLIVPGFTVIEKKKALIIFRILLPYLPIQIINSFFITVLNAEEKYGRAELLGITNTLVSILSLVLLYSYIDVWSLVVSLVLGKLIEFLFYSNQLYKFGFRYRFTLTMSEFDHNSYFKAMKNTFLYVGSTQVYSIILTASISFLPEGTYAVFKYVQNLANKINGLSIQPLLTIFFTKYSILVHELKSVKKMFQNNMQGIINISCIVIIVGILLGDFIIDFLWGGEKFDDGYVQLAYIFLLFNLGGNLLSGIGSIYRKMVVSKGKGGRLYFVWTASQMLSAFLTYLIIRNLQITGLLFIIPMNIFFMGLASYSVYKQTRDPVDFSFVNKQNLVLLILIVFSLTIKKYWLVSIYMSKASEIMLITLIAIVIIFHLVLSTYKLLLKNVDK